MVYIVMGASGKWELYDKWIVAAFTDRQKADDLCRKCNYYGKWLSGMVEQSFEEERYIPDLGVCQSQFTWAIEGSPGQFEAWEQEFFAEHPDSTKDDWCQYYRTELAWMLNPHDTTTVLWSMYERNIEYKVVEVPLDGDQ
jgi:hypothetical protein